MKKRKKLSKHTRYELSEYYAVKRDDMMCLAFTMGVIGYFLKIPLLIFLGDLVGMSENAADNWSWAPMAPGLIFGWIGLYFSFRSWLADPYKNI